METVKTRIKKAYLTLLETKENNDITTSEIIKKAGVCRASFYRNYYKQSDIIDDCLIDVFERIEKIDIITPSTVEKHSDEVYRIFYEERHLLKVLYKRNLLHFLDSYFFNLCQKQIKLLKSYENEYQIACFTGASTFLLKTWIKNDFKDSPKVLQNTILKFTKQN